MVLVELSEAAGEKETGEKEKAGPLSGDCSPFPEACAQACLPLVLVRWDICTIRVTPALPCTPQIN